MNSYHSAGRTKPRAGDDKDQREGNPPKGDADDCDCDPDDPECDCHNEEDDEVTEQAKRRAASRCEAILGSTHARAFPAAAQQLAFRTRASAAEAKGVLKVLANPQSGSFAHLMPPAAAAARSGRRLSTDDRYVPAGVSAPSPRDAAKQIVALGEACFVRKQ